MTPRHALISSDPPSGVKEIVTTRTAAARRLPRARITVRGMMIAVAFTAIALWPVHNWRHRPYYEEMTKVHGLMAYLCTNEATLMKHRAESRGFYPRPGSGALHGTKLVKRSTTSSAAPIRVTAPNTARGPGRASGGLGARRDGKSQNAAEWHSRMCDYYNGWTIIDDLTQANDG